MSYHKSNIIVVLSVKLNL